MQMSINMSFTILAKSREPDAHVVASPGTLEQLTSDQHHILKTDIIHIKGIDKETFDTIQPPDCLSIVGEIKLVEHGFEVYNASLTISGSCEI